MYSAPILKVCIPYARQAFGKYSIGLVSIVLGSVSDWETMKHCAQTLENFGVPYERNIASAHRTPAKATEIASTAQARGIKVIIAAAGGAAHLAGVLVQMPRGVPVLTVAIGKAGAVNAAIAAVQMLALSDDAYAQKLEAFREKQTRDVLDAKFPD